MIAQIYLFSILFARKEVPLYCFFGNSICIAHNEHCKIMFRRIIFFFMLVLLLCNLSACKGSKRKSVVAPWGEVISDSTINNSVSNRNAILSVDDIIDCGELIALTMNGPETYFDYHGRGMGTQYLLCEKFAQKLGVSLRVEVCKDTTEMIDKLAGGDADIIIFMLPDDVSKKKGLIPCGAKTHGGDSHWAVANGNNNLADALECWYKPHFMDDIKKEERFLFSSNSVKRHVYAPFLDRTGGVISKYDALFRRYAPLARWDWRLLAAQCYQESCFDPNARSWAGACGLMQIMPSTADHLGLARSDMFHPERSIEAAVKFLAELTATFHEVPSTMERQCFVLASYNGGANHIKDAMALTRKYGGNPHRWAHVAPWVLRLQQPEYYNDPVVRNGYMRGSETVDYVDRIRQRYSQYGGVKYTGKSVPDENTIVPYSPNGMMPRRATKKYRYHI